MIAEATQYAKSLAAKLAMRRAVVVTARAADIREAINQIAAAEDGETKAKPDLDHIAGLLEDSGMSEAEFFACVATRRKRTKWAAQAARLSELKANADAAEKALSTFEAEFSEFMRIAREKRPALNLAAVRTRGEYVEAVAAEQELFATGDSHPDEPALSEQLTAIGRAADACSAKLSRHGNPSTSHVIVVAQLQDELRHAGKLTAEQRSELEKRLAFHRKAVADATSELASLDKQRIALLQKAAKLALEKLKPENFKIVRKPQHAVAV